MTSQSAYMASFKGTVAIISIGDMGLGIGRLLKSNGYRVITNAVGRSEWTLSRARSASIELLESDGEIVKQADYVLSIAPPRDAISIAERINTALSSLATPRTSVLTYVDMNAISPTTARAIAGIFSANSFIKFIDGGIIGSPPRPKSDTIASVKNSSLDSWLRPAVPISGPHKPNEDLMATLNMWCISNDVGSASGLKMCYASLTKGFTALAIQSFVTANALGVLPELKQQLSKPGFFLPMADISEMMLTTFPPKAYRWVREMEEIGDTFAVDGGFGTAEDMRGGDLFKSVAEIYRFVAEETDCGKERKEERRTSNSQEVADDITKALNKIRP